MTHEKAVALAHHAMVNSKSRAHGLVDALTVLGLLPFGGPDQNQFLNPTGVDMLDEIVEHVAKREARKPVSTVKLGGQLLETYGLGPYYIDQVLTALEKANLELVERK